MKAICRRIGRLETAAELRERRRCRLEREGVPVEELPPPLPPTVPACNASDLQLSIAETLRGRQRERRRAG
jgi:hypothetical protein